MTDAKVSSSGGDGPMLTAALVARVRRQQRCVCAPLLRKVTARETGEVQQLVIPCGSTRDAVCPPCAEEARRLRMQQCAEEWHREDEPLGSSLEDGQVRDGECAASDDVEGRRARRHGARSVRSAWGRHGATRVRPADARMRRIFRGCRSRIGRLDGRSPHRTARRIGRGAPTAEMELARRRCTPPTMTQLLDAPARLSN